MRYRVRSGLATITAAMLLGSGGAQALSAPTITAPTSGSTVLPTPTLRWTTVTGATSYRVYLRRGSSGPNIVPCGFNIAVDPNGCWLPVSVALAVATPLAPGAHTLWVMAKNASGSAQSSARPFTVTRRFEDRGLTVFDHQTSLEWEKKTDDSGIHDKDNYYKWSTVAPWNPVGTAFTVFLAGLNHGGECVTESTAGTRSEEHTSELQSPY